MLIPTFEFPNENFQKKNQCVAHPDFGRSVNPVSTRGGQITPPYMYMMEVTLLVPLLKSVTNALAKLAKHSDTCCPVCRHAFFCAMLYEF